MEASKKKEISKRKKNSQREKKNSQREKRIVKEEKAGNVDHVTWWRDHVTSLREGGKITALQAEFHSIDDQWKFNESSWLSQSRNEWMNE